MDVLLQPTEQTRSRRKCGATPFLPVESPLGWVRLLSRAWSPQRMNAPQQERCGDQICCEDRVNYLCRLHPCIVLAAPSTPFMKCQ